MTGKRILLIVTASVFILSGCNEKNNTTKNDAVALAVTPEPELLVEETAAPVGAELDELSSGHYYADENRLCELACLVVGDIVVDASGKKIGSIKEDVADIKCFDYYLGKNIVLKWKVGKTTWELQNDSWIYNRYRNLTVADGYVFCDSEYYLNKDGVLYYHNADGREVSLEVTVTQGNPWSIGTSENINFVTGKDKNGRVFYTQKLSGTD